MVNRWKKQKLRDTALCRLGILFAISFSILVMLISIPRTTLNRDSTDYDFDKDLEAKLDASLLRVAKGNKIPKSFVFSRTKLTGSVKQPQMELRKFMFPYIALSLKEKKRNTLRNFLNVSGPMDVDAAIEIDYEGAIFLWHVDKRDFTLWTITSTTTLFLGIEKSSKKGPEYWLLWKYEGESTLAGLIHSKEFPYNDWHVVQFIIVCLPCVFTSLYSL